MIKFKTSRRLVSDTSEAFYDELTPLDTWASADTVITSFPRHIYIIYIYIWVALKSYVDDVFIAYDLAYILSLYH